MGKIRDSGFRNLYHIDPKQYLKNIIDYWNSLKEDSWDEIKNAKTNIEIIQLQEKAKTIITNYPDLEYKFVANHYIDAIVDYTGVNFDIDITDRDSQELSGIKPIRLKNRTEYLFVDAVKPLYLKIAGISPVDKWIGLVNHWNSYKKSPRAEGVRMALLILQGQAKIFKDQYTDFYREVQLLFNLNSVQKECLEYANYQPKYKYPKNFPLPLEVHTLKLFKEDIINPNNNED